MIKVLYAFIIYHRRAAARRQPYAVAVNKRTWRWGLPNTLYTVGVCSVMACIHVVWD